jgi:NADH:ubiquinone oxidoreductase subunit 4 (subunit M)
MLWVIYRVVYGEPTQTVRDNVTEAKPIDVLTAGPLMLITAIIGLNWNVLLSYIDPVIEVLTKTLVRS